MTRAFGDAIALASPNGTISKRALKAAQERIRRKLFGDGLQMTTQVQPSRRDALMAEAKQLRELAERGMKVRAYRKRADELEAEANKL